MNPDLLIEHNLLRKRSGLLSAYQHSRYIVVTNAHIDTLYMERLKPLFTQSPYSVIHIAEGEAHKNLSSYQRIIDHLLHNHADRSACIIALGGGVITDIAGFAAATYLRGIDLINIPTTLLAQVDASIGSKTAINYGGIKNNVGAFYPALATWVDTQLLDSLDDRQWRNGMAEVIKAACIADREFFVWLQQHHTALTQRDSHDVTTMIQRAIAIKASIVKQDAKETGIRRSLNFGHSIGHAIEALDQFNSLLHGEAVSIGMSLAAAISTKTHELSTDEYHQILAMLSHWSLPTELPSNITINDLVPALLHDKKISHDQIKMVLLDSLGLSKICSMTIEQLTQELQRR